MSVTYLDDDELAALLGFSDEVGGETDEIDEIETPLASGGFLQKLTPQSPEVVFEENSEHRERPAAPAAAPSHVYDPDLERQEYGRALLSPKDLDYLNAEIAERGFFTIEQVRELVKQNSMKESRDTRDSLTIDPSMMIAVDVHTNYPVFIAGDSIHTREELFAHYPFEALRTSPEAVFVQQEVGIFSAGDTDEIEYVARDVGDTDEFTTIGDLVRRATRRANRGNSADRISNGPTRVVKTKIYVGKEGWVDFLAMRQFVRSFGTFVCGKNFLLEGPDAFGAAARSLQTGFVSSAPLAIRDAEGARAELERREQRTLAVLEALEQKVEALREKEKELEAREAAVEKSASRV